VRVAQVHKKAPWGAYQIAAHGSNLISEAASWCRIERPESADSSAKLGDEGGKPCGVLDHKISRGVTRCVVHELTRFRRGVSPPNFEREDRDPSTTEKGSCVCSRLDVTSTLELTRASECRFSIRDQNGIGTLGALQHVLSAFQGGRCIGESARGSECL